MNTEKKEVKTGYCAVVRHVLTGESFNLVHEKRDKVSAWMQELQREGLEIVQHLAQCQYVVCCILQKSPTGRDIKRNISASLYGRAAYESKGSVNAILQKRA